MSYILFISYFIGIYSCVFIRFHFRVVRENFPCAQIFFGDAQFFPRGGVEIPAHGLQEKASCVGLRRAM